VNGVLAQASALDPAYAPPLAPATQLDLIGSAISQLESLGYEVDAIVANGVDINKTRLLKNSFGGYLWSDPDSPVGTSAMWSVPLIRSVAMPRGTFLVAALAQSAMLFQREVMTILIAFQDQDDFIRNLCTFRAEERIALAVLLPQGLIKGTFPSTGSATTSTAPAPHTSAPTPKK
jgi:HK97 family phage major capsid protein